MARRRPASPATVGRAAATSQSQPRLFAFFLAQAAAFGLFLISHFATEACALCRVQQVLMVALLAAIGINLVQKRPHKFLRETMWLAWAGLLTAAVHIVLSLGVVVDPCTGFTACGHADPRGASRALPAAAALLAFGLLLLLVRKAEAQLRPLGRHETTSRRVRSKGPST